MISDLGSALVDLIDFALIADSVLANTARPIEGLVITACQRYVNVLPTGITVSPRAWTGSELQDSELKTWLDRRSPGTVLFVSFG